MRPRADFVQSTELLYGLTEEILYSFFSWLEAGPRLVTGQLQITNSSLRIANSFLNFPSV